MNTVEDIWVLGDFWAPLGTAGPFPREMLPVNEADYHRSPLWDTWSSTPALLLCCHQDMVVIEHEDKYMMPFLQVCILRVGEALTLRAPEYVSFTCRVWTVGWSDFLFWLTLCQTDVRLERGSFCLSDLKFLLCRRHPYCNENHGSYICR